MNGEGPETGKAKERWKVKGVALRVLFYVFFGYAFLYVIGTLGAQAQK
ncbi:MULTISPECIES: hypothetical protein [Streptomyces]|uniref:Uncharacterized protein n=1 Tax=Streptomyces ramulosus TaxID=47762 RepID=A0ABW1FC40_9ACTN